MTKLRTETIEAIIKEIEPIKSLLSNQKGLSKQEVFDEAVKLGFDCIKPYIGADDEDDYIDIASDHVITTIYYLDDAFILGSIDVYEDDSSCGIWDYEEIINNEVEFNCYSE